MELKHKNIPIFIPHLGCPHDCVFCNQKKISGHGAFVPDTVIPEIEAALSTMKDGEMPEIAFFGGSFTGIKQNLMISLLDIAEKYVHDGKVSGIRMSTRPDYISEEILDILSNYTVSAVELGLQSFDDCVLLRAERGHTSSDSEKACRMITSRNIPLVGQMMIGLPDATPESEIETAKKIVSLGCVAARVYPTVVFRSTKLCRMAERGEYSPLTDEEAVMRTKSVLRILLDGGLTVIRIGLCSNEDIRDPEEVYAGATHPALGELCLGEIFYDIIREGLIEKKETIAGESITVFVPKASLSKAIGQKRKNIIRLQNEFCRDMKIKNIRIVGSSDLSGFDFKISTDT